MSRPSTRELYRVLGPRLFWRSLLWGCSLHTLPRDYNPAAEVWQRAMERQAQEVLNATNR